MAEPTTPLREERKTYYEMPQGVWVDPLGMAVNNDEILIKIYCSHQDKKAGALNTHKGG
jgi:hypothetical protein